MSKPRSSRVSKEEKASDFLFPNNELRETIPVVETKRERSGTGILIDCEWEEIKDCKKSFKPVE